MSDTTQEQKCRPWLKWIALVIFVLGLVLRLSHARELSAGVAYELEAAYRMQIGQCPFLDFYFDRMMPIVVWRMITLAMAHLVAAVSFAPTGLADCFYNIKVLGLSSVIATSALSIFSFYLCWTIMDRFGRAVLADHIRSLILIAMALGNLAMGFEYGEQQHIFILFFLPYMLVRWFVTHGADVARRIKIITGALAALAASFNPLYLALIIVYELSEAFSCCRAKCSLKQPAIVSGLPPVKAQPKTFFESTLTAFVLTSTVLWLSFLLLPKPATQAFFEWIVPLKVHALSHDNYSFYGSYVTPERKSLFYTAVLALIFAFGGMARFWPLRPMASLTVLGLCIWMTMVLGLSADALILTYFTTMLLTVEGYFAAQWLTATYPRLFWRKKEQALVALIICATLAASIFLVGNEIYQRKLVKTAFTRLRPAFNLELVDLAQVVKDNTKPRAKVMIINGNLRPAFPLLALAERSTCGYFLGSEALGTLSNMRTRDSYSYYWGTGESYMKQLEKSLYDRLLLDIQREQPELICIQGGEIEGAIKHCKIQDAISARYEKIAEAQYFTDFVGLREVSEANYNYWIYKIKH